MSLLLAVQIFNVVNQEVILEVVKAAEANLSQCYLGHQSEQ